MKIKNRLKQIEISGNRMELCIERTDLCIKDRIFKKKSAIIILELAGQLCYNNPRQ